MLPPVTPQSDEVSIPFQADPRVTTRKYAKAHPATFLTIVNPAALPAPDSPDEPLQHSSEYQQQVIPTMSSRIMLDHSHLHRLRSSPLPDSPHRRPHQDRSLEYREERDMQTNHCFHYHPNLVLHLCSLDNQLKNFPRDHQLHRKIMAASLRQARSDLVHSVLLQVTISLSVYLPLMVHSRPCRRAWPRLGQACCELILPLLHRRLQLCESVTDHEHQLPSIVDSRRIASTET